MLYSIFIGIYSMCAVACGQKQDFIKIMPVGVSYFKVPVLIKDLYLILLPMSAAAKSVNAVYRNGLFI